MDSAVVYHIVYGRGTVSAKGEKTVRVHFEKDGIGEKTFVYPDAFRSFLRYEDAEAQAQMTLQLTESEKQAQAKRAERALQRAAALEEIRRQQKLMTQAKRKASPRPARAKKATAKTEE